MKKLLLVLTVVAMASFLLVGCLGTTPDADEVVTIAIIPGVTAPVTGATPVAATTATAQYTGVVTWLPDDVTFAAETVYTATITLTAKAGFTLTGVTADFFTVASATAANLVDSGVVEAVFPATEAALVVVEPTIDTIDDQEVAWDFAVPWTKQVEWTVGTGTITDFSLTGEPATMTISAAGLITWTNIASTPAVYEITVTVVTTDGSDTETFVITVVEPDPLVIDIDVPGAYIHPTKGPIVAADCYEVVVTFSDNSATEGQDVWARWSDVVGAADGSWVLLTGNTDDTEFTGEICFDGVETECDLICIEVKVGTICCDPIIYSENITVDSIAPCASFTVCVDDCGLCTEGAEMSWVTTCEDVCDLGYDCCDDYCSGVADWTFVLDDDYCDGPCDTEPGTGCPINGAFECGCLLYATEAEEFVEHVVDITIADNVGNTFTDTWTLTFDTDSLVSFTAGSATPELVEGVCDWDYYVDYGCDWTDCAECVPEVED